jgi:endonuclease/exonuclease/phosphatase family metal-dependent hydrolase
MKHLLCIVLSALAVSCGSEPLRLNVMTFNIRLDTAADSLNAWPYRRDAAAAAIAAGEVDLLGTQEVLHHQLNDLKARLPGYRAVGVGRADGREAGEYSAVFYRESRFAEVASGNFWLSPTPDSAGSRGWDAACERIATWVILREHGSGRQLFFLNTHLDHVGETARRESISLILERAGELSRGLPVIITGDFNARPDSEVIERMLSSGEYRDARLVSPDVAGLEGTFHGFGRIPADRRGRIDYIFVNPSFDVTAYAVLPERRDGICVSDHAPVIARLTLAER